MSFEKIKSIIRRNILQFICLIIILTYLSYDFFSSEYELKNFGNETEATVIECKMIRKNGACHVKIVFETNKNKERAEEGTLYYDENCVVGKKIKIRYSIKSELWDPIEE